MDWLPTILLVAQLVSLGQSERRIINLTSEASDDVSSLHGEPSTFGRTPIQIVRGERRTTEPPDEKSGTRKTKFTPPRFTQDNFGSRIVPLSRRPENAALSPEVVTTTIPRQRSREPTRERKTTVPTSPPRSTIHRVVGGHVRIRTTSTPTTAPPPTKDPAATKNDDDEDSKTLSQQVADGKYGLIQELFLHGPKRPGIISYDDNKEVPHDAIENLGGLNPEEIWLSEGHVLVLKGGAFPEKDTFDNNVWKPIDDYVAPPRQVKIPANPSVPPPFPIQLYDGGPVEFVGGNKSRVPFFPFFFPPPGNFTPGSQPPFPFPQGFRPPNGTNPFFFPPPNNGTPFRPPFFPGQPPQGLPPRPPISLENLTDIIDDDPSIFYPPPYDFFYPKDNSTEIPPGPLVPGIVLPPPPNFFAPLENDTYPRGRRPKVRPMPRPTSPPYRGNQDPYRDVYQKPGRPRPQTERPYYVYNTVTTTPTPPYYGTKEGVTTPKYYYGYSNVGAGRHQGKVQSPEIRIVERPTPPIQYIVTTAKKVTPTTRPVYVFDAKKIPKGGDTTTISPPIYYNIQENINDVQPEMKPYFVYEPPRDIVGNKGTVTIDPTQPPAQPYYVYNEPGRYKYLKTSTTTSKPPLYYYLNPGTKGNQPSARPIYAYEDPNTVKVTTPTPIYYYTSHKPDKLKPTMRPIIVYEDPRVIHHGKGQTPTGSPPIIVYNTPGTLDNKGRPSPHPYYVYEDNQRYKTIQDATPKPPPQYYRIPEYGGSPNNVKGGVSTTTAPPYYYNVRPSPTPSVTRVPDQHYYNQNQVSPSPTPLYVYNLPAKGTTKTTSAPQYYYVLTGDQGQGVSPSPVQSYVYIDPNTGQRYPTAYPQSYKQNLVTVKPEYQGKVNNYVNPVTDAPVNPYVTHAGGHGFDDITKQYFSAFGQKLPENGGHYGSTTPITTLNFPQSPVTEIPLKKPYQHVPYKSSTAIPLHDDILVNYKKPLPGVNPDSEYVTPLITNVHDGQGSLVSYDLPGGNGGHYYFLTPQAILRRTARNQNQAASQSESSIRVNTRPRKNAGQFSASGD